MIEDTADFQWNRGVEVGEKRGNGGNFERLMMSDTNDKKRIGERRTANEEL